MNLIKLQDDLYIPDNFAENHKYFADENGEKKYTGITTILGTLAKPMLIPWAARMATEYIAENKLRFSGGTIEFDDEEFVKVLAEAKVAHTKKKEKAGEHGTSQHALCEEWINKMIKEYAGVPQNDYAMDSDDPIIKFKAWACENVAQFLFSERPVHSKSLFLAGTIDAGAVMKDGKRKIIDLKTGSGIYYEAVLQCEAYQLLAEEEGDAKYDGSVIVLLGKDGSFQTQVRERGEIDENAFFGLLQAYRGSQTFIKPKN